MPYLRSNEDGSTYKISSVMPTMTQKGFPAIMFIGEAVPETQSKGFIYFDDDDILIADYSEYNNFYKPNIFAISKDVPIDPKPNNKSEGSQIYNSSIISDVMDLKRKVADMETYTETKPVFIHNTQCVFEVEKIGAVSAQLTVGGIITPCQFTVNKNQITVSFEELEEVGEVTIYIIP